MQHFERCILIYYIISHLVAVADITVGCSDKQGVISLIHIYYVSVSVLTHGYRVRGVKTFAEKGLAVVRWQIQET